MFIFVLIMVIVIHLEPSCKPSWTWSNYNFPCFKILYGLVLCSKSLSSQHGLFFFSILLNLFGVLMWSDHQNAWTVLNSCKEAFECCLSWSNYLQSTGYGTALAMVAGTTLLGRPSLLWYCCLKLKNLNLLHGFVMLDVPQEASFFWFLLSIYSVDAPHTHYEVWQISILWMFFITMANHMKFKC